MVPTARGKTMYQEIIPISPEMAMEILESIENNRPLSQTRINRYAEIMSRGGWRYDNGETMKVDTTGKWIDGQHRLWAITYSKKTIKILVQFNVAPDAFETIDTGGNRKASDILGIEHQTNCKLLAATLNLVYGNERGSIRGKNQHYMLTNDIVMEIFEKHKKIIDSIDFVKKYTYKKGFFPQSCAVFLHYVFSKKNKEAADEFFDKLILGENLGKGAMLLKLRNVFLTDMISKKKMNNTDKLAMCIKVWNATREGKTIKQLKYINGENFPKIQ
jgi:hypothetical protein